MKSRKPRQSVPYIGAGLLSVESTLGPLEAGWHMHHAYKMAEALQSSQAPPVSIGLMKKLPPRTENLAELWY